MADADGKEGGTLAQARGSTVAEGEHTGGKADDTVTRLPGSVPVKAVLGDQVADREFAGVSAAAAEHDEDCARLDGATAPMWGQKFVPVGPWELETHKTNRSKLSVMSFNVLAQSRAQVSSFPYCRSNMLTWTIRRANLLAQILEVDPDILMLQDADNWKEWWQPELRRAGYDGLYEKQTGRSRVGVAVLFKRELFQLFRSERILFDDLCSDLPASEATRAKQGNVGTMALLQPWEDCPFTSAIVVASLQFKDGVGFRELRRWQTKLAFQRIQKFNEDFSVPVLVGLCAEEDPGTPLYHMLATGFMPQLPKKPRQPSRPIATILSMSSARVEWKAPFDPGDGEILGYRIEKRAGGNKVVGYVIAATTKPSQTWVIITGLSSGMSYEFRITAVNKFGIGLFSPSSPPITMPVPKSRNAVNFIELRRLSNASIESADSQRTHVSVAKSRCGNTPRFDGGGSHLNAPPTRPGPVQGPSCDAHCQAHHRNRVHYLELNSVYSTFGTLFPKTAAQMKEFAAHKLEWAAQTDELARYKVSLKRPSTVNVLDLDHDSGEDVAAAPAAPPAAAPSSPTRKPRKRRTAGCDSDSDVSTVDEVDDVAAVTFSTEVTVHRVPAAESADAGGAAAGAGAGAGAGADDGGVDEDALAADMLARLGDDEIPSRGATPSSFMSSAIGSHEPPVMRLDRSAKVPNCDSFLLYSRGALSLHAVMTLLTPQQVREMDPKHDLPYLPNRQFSSDHLPQAAIFEFNDAAVSSMWQ